MIMGDFNAHLVDGRGTTPNAQGVAIGNVINKYNLYVASLDKETSGPSYTYCSGGIRTTVDYILVNQPASYLITSSAALQDHRLNTSDHLELKCRPRRLPRHSAERVPFLGLASKMLAVSATRKG
jgi:hypothetical protein